MLVTTLTGLVPGRRYGVYVCYLSATDADWRVRAGFAPGTLETFTSNLPSGRVENLGLSATIGSNRSQLRAFLGNATADGSGRLLVYLDDDTVDDHMARTWLDALAVGPEVEVVLPWLPDGTTVLANDGVWTWFNNPRALFHNGRLYVGYVKANGSRPALSVYTPATGVASELFTFTMPENDDHNNPGLTANAAGGLVAIASKHGTDRRLVGRVSTSTDPSTLAQWSSELITNLPVIGPTNTSYNNPFLLTAEAGRIVNFIRYINWNPTIVTSDDGGATWSTPIHFLKTGTGSVRPYFQYAGNGVNRLDAIYTDGHPRDSNNSVYHLYYESDIAGTPGAGSFRYSDGQVMKTGLAALPFDLDAGERGTVIYQYSAAASPDPNAWIAGGRAWVWDLVYDADGRPVCGFQVQRDNVTGSGWQHDRIYYYYARWTGTGWQKRFIAQAGRGLYASEDDYGGGLTIDPQDPNVVYLSSNARYPFDLSSLDNVPLAVGEKYELYRGVTQDGGLTFEWSAVTRNSTEDNIRPYVPRGHSLARSLVWLRGTYSTYTSFATRVLGLFRAQPLSYSDWAVSVPGAASASDPLADADGDGRSNLLEFAFGGDPLAATPARGPAGAVVAGTGDESEQTFLELEFRQLRGGSGTVGLDYTAAGVRYAVEVSPTMAEGTWQAGADLVAAVGAPIDHGDGTETVRVRVRNPLSATAGRVFARLRVTME